MEENKPQEFDPRDLNQDGKVTLGEKVQYAAGKVADKSKELYAEAKDKAADLKEKAADKIDTAKQKIQEKKDEKEA